MTSRALMGMLLALCLLACGSTQGAEPAESARPNIVWIIPDDMSANFSCYGETSIETPNVDRLAARGLKFNNAYVTAPVCSTCRSAFITGMYQTSIGAHHHRSGRGELKIELPEDVELVPKLFQQAGYFTTISGWPVGKKLGKTDYNFEWDPAVYDGSDWAERKPGQPFFAQIQTPGGKLRGKDAQGWEKIGSAAERKLGSRTTTDVVELPPYYPQHPDIIQDWAAYLDSVRMTDVMVGEVLARLQEEGVLENTLVLFMTDHGISHARGKQFLYDEGLHVPLVMAGPGIEPATVRDDLVEHIDIAALSLAAAGIKIPANMQARDILSPEYEPREAVFAARDRCDETVDLIRSVRTKRFKYIRNFLPGRPYLQPCAYKDAKAILIALRKYHVAEKLNDVQELLFRDTRPAEELYDLDADPNEINNLADNPEFSATLLSLRQQLGDWMFETKDQGRTPESAEMYDSDMAVYLNKLQKSNPAHAKGIEENIRLMKRWAAEESSTGLTPIDWVIIFLYATCTIGLGWYFSRRQTSTREYFIGTGNMNPILIGVSLFATLLSTISYLSLPGESLGKGPVYLASLLSIPAVYLVVGYILLPVYMRQRVTSAYELLEAKLGISIRLLGATMFIALRLVWMSLLVFLTAKAMVTMLGVGDDWIPYIALATGFIAVVYTSLGGLQASGDYGLLQTTLLAGGGHCWYSSPSASKKEELVGFPPGGRAIGTPNRCSTSIGNPSDVVRDDAGIFHLASLHGWRRSDLGPAVYVHARCSSRAACLRHATCREYHSRHYVGPRRIRAAELLPTSPRRTSGQLGVEAYGRQDLPPLHFVPPAGGSLRARGFCDVCRSHEQRGLRRKLHHRGGDDRLPGSIRQEASDRTRAPDSGQMPGVYHRCNCHPWELVHRSHPRQHHRGHPKDFEPAHHPDFLPVLLCAVRAIRHHTWSLGWCHRGNNHRRANRVLAVFLRAS